MPSEYYWRARNANTRHQNSISGREDHQRGTQCHQNTISGREDHPSGTLCNQNTVSGRRDDDSRTQCHQNTISGREDNQRGTQCHQNTISGRKDRGPPRLGLTKLLTSGCQISRNKGEIKKKEIRNGVGEIRISGVAWISTSPQGKIKKFTLQNDHVAYVESVFFAKKCCRSAKNGQKMHHVTSILPFFALSNSGITFL